MTTLKFKIHKKVGDYMGCWFKTKYSSPTYFCISSEFYDNDPEFLSFTLLGDVVRGIKHLHKFSRTEFQEELATGDYRKVSSTEILEEIEKEREKERERLNLHKFNS